MTMENPVDMMRYRDIYAKTIDKWGEKAQYEQTVEECAELIATLQHFARGKVDRRVVIDELADVYLMLGQLIYMFGEEDFTCALDKKITKLHELLNKTDAL
jgi:NTP pyrophosphatase (non-canonical NTP hydrolase)